MFLHSVHFVIFPLYSSHQCLLLLLRLSLQKDSRKPNHLFYLSHSRFFMLATVLIHFCTEFSYLLDLQGCHKIPWDLTYDMTQLMNYKFPKFLYFKEWCFRKQARGQSCLLKIWWPCHKLQLHHITGSLSAASCMNKLHCTTPLLLQRDGMLKQGPDEAAHLNRDMKRIVVPLHEPLIFVCHPNLCLSPKMPSPLHQ